jgi:hypothetical protein
MTSELHELVNRSFTAHVARRFTLLLAFWGLFDICRQHFLLGLLLSLSLLLLVLAWSSSLSGGGSSLLSLLLLVRCLLFGLSALSLNCITEVSIITLRVSSN